MNELGTIVSAVRSEAPTKRDAEARAQFVVWLARNRPDIYREAVRRLKSDGTLSGFSLGKAFKSIGDAVKDVTKTVVQPVKDILHGDFQNAIGSTLTAGSAIVTGGATVLVKPLKKVEQTVTRAVSEKPLKIISGAAAGFATGGNPFTAAAGAIMAAVGVGVQNLQKQKTEAAMKKAAELDKLAKDYAAQLTALKPGQKAPPIPSALLPYLSDDEIAAIRAIGGNSAANSAVQNAVNNSGNRRDAVTVGRLTAAQNGVTQSAVDAALPALSLPSFFKNPDGSLNWLTIGGSAAVVILLLKK